MQSKEDKRVFCENYKKNKDGLAQNIQQEANRRQFLNREDINHEFKGLQDEISRLKAEFDKEQEWEPYEACAMNWVDYEALAKSGRRLDAKEAVSLVANEFGFTEDKVILIETIPLYKKNRHGKIQRCGTQERPPVYDATDYNYIRFDVRTAGATYSWEMVNGELEPYMQ